MNGSRLIAAALGVVLLVACGTERPGSEPTRDRVSPGAACPPPSPGAGDPSDLAKAGARITRVSGEAPRCVEFEVTNSGLETATYTISLTLLNRAGEALATSEQTVRAVPPGQTKRGSLTGERLLFARVKISSVRSVPVDELPGSCPASGMRVYADRDAEAAMGLRVLGIHVQNCGRRPLRLNGYPKLQPLDENHEPLQGVRVLHGTRAITTGIPAGEQDPRPITVKPGDRASAILAWRNTTGDGGPVHGPYLRVSAKAGVAPVILTPELDLGTTGKLAVGPWHPAK